MMKYSRRHISSHRRAPWVRRWLVTCVPLLITGQQALAQQESLCAEAKLEVRQQVTLERQAFDARLQIGNGLPAVAIEKLHVSVTFSDAAGNPVVASSDPAETNAAFFISLLNLTGVDSIEGAGTIAPATAAEISWLIIPVPGAGGDSPIGTRYYVGAELRYQLAGEDHDMVIAPDTIVVRPMPVLSLDYFLPIAVTGDDAFTQELEPPVPFSLGARVGNAGYGEASDLRIDSGQLKIIENERGLQVEFVILGTEVNGRSAPDRLLVEFGDIPPLSAATARWMMQCSLSGEFTGFESTFSHADALGGELTSLITTVRTHRLVRDVLVDSLGHDGIRDFLSKDGEALTVYGSDNTDESVQDLSATATLSLVDVVGSRSVFELVMPSAPGPVYAAMPFDNSDGVSILSATRDDGKAVAEPNRWFSKTRDPATQPWEHFINLFDVKGGGTYSITVSGVLHSNEPPVLVAIGDQATRIGDAGGIQFTVQASDANATVPGLTSTALPAGAIWNVSTNGLIAEGAFQWIPIAGQEGIYPVRFTASDGVLSASERMRIYVGKAGEPLSTNGIPQSLDGYSVVVTSLVASSTGSTATLKWAAAAGMEYDIYYSDDALGNGIGWVSAVTNHIAATGNEAFQDTSLGTARMQRFYQVVLGGEAPYQKGIWGVIRRDVDARSYAFVAPPLRLDGAIDGDLGRILARALTGDDGGPGDGVGDELYLLQPNGSWRTLYLDGAGSWREEDASPATAALPAGTGLIVLRNQDAPSRLTFTGPVGNDGSREVVVREGWNLLNLSEGRELALTGLFDRAGPAGARLEQDADQVIIWDENGDGHWLMYAEGWGAPYDGNWVDISTFTIPELTLKPGRTLYYYRQPEAGAMNVDY